MTLKFRFIRALIVFSVFLFCGGFLFASNGGDSVPAALAVTADSHNQSADTLPGASQTDKDTVLVLVYGLSRIDMARLSADSLLLSDALAADSVYRIVKARVCADSLIMIDNAILIGDKSRIEKARLSADSLIKIDTMHNFVAPVSSATQHDSPPQTVGGSVSDKGAGGSDYVDDYVDAMPQSESDFARLRRRYTHFVGLETSFGRVATTGNNFMKGNNLKGTPISNQSLYAIKYGFQARRGTSQDILYGSPYQGVGLFLSTYYHKQDLGTPWGIYLFQGARIASISPRLSFNYEWKFGLSGGWKHYRYPDNMINDVIGSKLNAYINAAFYFNYIVDKNFGLNFGLSATHYSNGNTRTPNNGINIISGIVGVKYYFNREYDRYFSTRHILRPSFKRAMSYELSSYLSWKDAILDTTNYPLDKPYLNRKLLVAGVSFAPMYVLSRKIRIGGSLDFSYDKSRGMSYELTPNGLRYTPAKPSDRMALGVSAKADFVMPYFTISAALGYDVIQGAGSLPPFYQVVSLRFEVIPHMFLMIGYKARQFRYPDNLMCGLGFRFGRGTRYQL